MQIDTSTLLYFLSTQEYRLLLSKVQLSTPQVTYLGLAITPPHKVIILDKEQSPQHQGQNSILLKDGQLLTLSDSFFLLYVRLPSGPHRNPS